MGGGLCGPSSLLDSVDLCLGGSPNVPGVMSERNALLVFKNIFHISNGFLKLHSLEDSGGLIGVFEVSSQVLDFALGG